MKHTSISFLYLILFIILPPASARANWQRSVTNYTRQDYRAASQNWDIMQQANGWMYFANNKGLLEFDGTNWTVYSMHGVKMKAMAAGHDGRIYAGGLKEFGYFEPDKWGQLQYVSLSDSLEAVKNVWSVQVCDGKVYYQEDNSVYCFENGQTQVIPQWLVYSTLINGCFYGAGEGIVRMHNGQLVTLPGTAGKLDSVIKRVVGIFAYDRQTLLVVTAQSGLYLYKNEKLQPFRTKADELLRQNRLSYAAMSGNMLALGSVQDGVFLLDLAENTVEHISTHNGLQNKSVLSLEFDRDENLWVGLNSGIDCIHLHSQVPFYCLSVGSGYASCFYNGHLYMGTNQGLFVSDRPLTPGNDPQVRETAWTAGQVYSLSSHQGDLFCAGSRALGVVKPDGEMYLIPGLPGVWSIQDLPGNKRLLAATYIGFYLLEKTGGRWQIAERIKGKPYSSKSFCNEPGTGALWTANKEDGIHRLLLSEKGDSVVWEKCYNSASLPKGHNVCITLVDGKVTVASHNGLFRYDSKRDELVRDTLLEAAADGPTSYTYVFQDSIRNIWYVTKGTLKLLHYDFLQNEYVRRAGEVYLADALVEDFEHINVYGQTAEKVLVGLEDGFALLRIDRNIQPPASPLVLQVRRVYATGTKDSLIYGSSYLPAPVPTLRIPYEYNSVSITYGADNYDKSLVQLYSCRLEGPVNESWSRPDEVSEQKYVALAEGHYTFRVRAFVNDGKFVESSISFEILPPWYHTWWFRTASGLAIIAVLSFAAFRLYSWRHRRLMKKMHELYSQQQVFKEESEKKDTEIDQLREENLQAELNHRSEELMRTTLNIVRKNEMLHNIRKEVVNLSHSINEETPDLVAMRRKVLRLLGQIDTNIEHDNDLEAFQTSFDSVHHDFFRQLEAAYPSLTLKEKLLCAYIKMNLLSKEIAPLLNISVRGVEISRYRLRKKLNLTEGENLTEFLCRFSR